MHEMLRVNRWMRCSAAVVALVAIAAVSACDTWAPQGATDQARVPDAALIDARGADARSDIRGVGDASRAGFARGDAAVDAGVLARVDLRLWEVGEDAPDDLRFAEPATRMSRVVMDAGLAAGQWPAEGSRVRIPLWDDVVWEGEVTRHRQHPFGPVSFVVRVDAPVEAYVYAAVDGDNWYWVLDAPHAPAIVFLRSDGRGDIVLMEAMREDLDVHSCGGAVDIPDRLDVPTPPAGDPLDLPEQEHDRLRDGEQPGGLPGGWRPKSVDTTIDVLGVYTPAAASWASSNAVSIGNVFAVAFERANVSLENSEVSLEFRLVRIIETDYEESGTSGTDLDRLRQTNDGFMDEVHGVRDQEGADLVAILTRTDDTGGIAYLLTNTNGSPAFGFSLSRVQQSTFSYTVAHELGHNMGNAHSRLQDDAPAGASGGLRTYSTGWRWVAAGIPEVSVMTYSGYYSGTELTYVEVPHFSNPSVSRSGVATGRSASGQGGPANNARSMREIMGVVANYRTRWTITASATAGGTIEPSGVVGVGNGRGVTFTITPDADRVLSELLVDGVSVTPTTSYAFTNVQADRSIEAHFGQGQVITFPVDPEGYLFRDESLTLSATASSGLPVSYRLISGPGTIEADVLRFDAGGVFVVEATQEGDADYAPAEPVERSIEVFYVLTPSAGAGGTIMPDTPTKVSAGDSQVFVFSPEGGRSVRQVLVDGVEVPVAASYTFEDVDADGSIEVSFGLEQSIDFPQPGPFAFLDSPVALTASADSGLPVTFRLIEGPASLDGDSVTFTDAGEVIVEAQQAGDASYAPAAPVRRTIVVTPAPGEIRFVLLERTFNGSAQEPMVETTPAGLPTRLVWAGGSAPTLPGQYPVRAEIAGGGYAGFAEDVFVIVPAEATLTLTQGEVTFNGSPQVPLLSTTPTGLAYSLTWAGGGGAPSDAGSYPFTATITTPGYVGSLEGTFVILPRPVSFSLSNLTQTFNDTPRSPTVSTTPTGVAFVIDWDAGSAPVDPGSYGFVVRPASANYVGERAGTLVIEPIVAQVALASLTQQYTGTPRLPAVITTPVDLAYSLVWDDEVAVQAGSYGFRVQITERGYAGAATGVMTVTQATAVVTVLSASLVYSGQPVVASAVTNPPGLPYEVIYLDSEGPPVDAGLYRVRAELRDRNYVGSGEGTISIARAQPEITLAGLTQVYTGTPRAVSVTVAPDLPFTLTYAGSPTAPTVVGSYPVRVEVSTANYVGARDALLNITRATATLTFGEIDHVFDGGAKQPVVTTVPPGLPVTLSLQNPPPSGQAVDAGTYRFRAVVVDPNYQGEASTDLVIRPAPAQVRVVQAERTYSGEPRLPLLETTPPGLEVEIVFSDLGGAPVEAGDYAFEATIVERNYEGSASGVLRIVPALAVVQLLDLQQVYTGQARLVRVVTSPSGLGFELTYAGSADAPFNAGSYPVVARVVDRNYVGEAEGTLVVDTALATLRLEDLTQTYNASPRPVRVVTTPGGLSTRVTYNGSETVPRDVGVYDVRVTVTDPNYRGNTQGELRVLRRTLTLTLEELDQPYDGTAREVRVVGAGDAPVQVTYNGLLTPPVNAGSYTVVATVDTANEGGQVSGTLVVRPAVAEVIITNLVWPYTGSPPTPTVTTQPAGLFVQRLWLPTGTPPVNAGTYTLRATVDNLNYVGEGEAQVTITPRAVTFVLNGLQQVYDGSPRVVEVESDPVGIPYRLRYDGQTGAPRNAGTYAITVESTDLNHVGEAAGTLVVAPRPVSVQLLDLEHVFDGNPKAVRVTTQPAGIAVAVTYDGEADPPSRAGTYEVVARVTDPNHVGEASATLRIRGRQAGLSLTDLVQTFDGTPRRVGVVAELPAADVVVTYDGSLNPPINAGSYAVVARYAAEDIEGEARGTLVVQPRALTLSLEDLAQPFTGTPRVVRVVGVPEGVALRVTYDGSEEPPVASGTYAVVAEVIDPNYSGSVSGTLRVAGLQALVQVDPVERVYDGSPLEPRFTTDPPGLAVQVTFNGAQEAPRDAGAYRILVEVVEPNYVGSGEAEGRILPAPAVVTLVGLAQTYSGGPRPVAVVTEPADLEVTLTYDGAAAPPVDAGSYAVEAVVVDRNHEGSTTGTLVVARRSATIRLLDLEQQADGTNKVPRVETEPTGLAVVLRYDGQAQAPRAAGSYAVEAEVEDPNHEGSAVATFVLVCPAVTCTLGEDTCDTGGRRVQQCREVSWGCVVLQPGQACAAEERCDAGRCVGLCEDACALNSVQCSGAGLPQVCTRGPNGCTRWESRTACPGEQRCVDGACSLVCEGACSPGDRLCSGNRPGLCVAGTETTCPRVQLSQACEEPNICQGGLCSPRCGAGCVPGASRCTPAARATETCVADDEGCTAWQEADVCAANESCFNGECRPRGGADVDDPDRPAPPASPRGSKGGCTSSSGGPPSGGWWVGLLALGLLWRKRRPRGAP